jgi:hypothetical protein
MFHLIDKETPVTSNELSTTRISNELSTNYLDIAQRIVYKGVKPSCRESFLGRKRNPQRTPNSFFAGFFIKPRRVPYQDLPRTSLLLVSTESWQKKERRCGIYKEVKRRKTFKCLIILLTFTTQERGKSYAF